MRVCERVARGARPGQLSERLNQPHKPPLLPAVQETSLLVRRPETRQGPRWGAEPSSPSARTLRSAPHTPGRSPGLSSGPPEPCSPCQSTSLRLLGGSVWKRRVHANALFTFCKTSDAGLSESIKIRKVHGAQEPAVRLAQPVLTQGAPCRPSRPPPRRPPPLTAAGT